jgi:hypothetical protein
MKSIHNPYSRICDAQGSHAPAHLSRSAAFAYLLHCNTASNFTGCEHARIYRRRTRAAVCRALSGRLAGDRLGLGDGDGVCPVVCRGAGLGVAARRVAAAADDPGCAGPGAVTASATSSCPNLSEALAQAEAEAAYGW